MKVEFASKSLWDDSRALMRLEALAHSNFRVDGSS